MKLLIVFLVLTFATNLSAAETEVDALSSRIKKELPDRGWRIDNLVSSLVITGPKVRTLSLCSLPPMIDKKLWRELSSSVRVEIVINLQGRILDDDLRQLEQTQTRFRETMDRVNHEIDHLGKDGHAHVREFGFVRLPDFRSPSSSIFVSDNIAGRSELPMIGVDPESVRDVVHKIYQAIEVYCREEADSPLAKKEPATVPERKE